MREKAAAMTEASNEAKFVEELLGFVRAETMTRRPLVLTTDLAKDIWIDGDDAKEFIRRFQARFNVDMSEFDFGVYLGAEGFDLVRLVMSSVAGRRSKAPITIGMLLRAAKDRRWPGVELQ